MDFAGGEDRDFLPRDVEVASKFFWGGDWRAIGFLTAGGHWLVVALRGEEKISVLADSSDEMGFGGKVSDKILIGEPSVDGDPEGSRDMEGKTIDHLAQSLDAPGALAHDVALTLSLPIEFPLFRGSVFFGLDRGGRMEEVKGDHARWPGLNTLRKGQRDLEKALSSDEVDLEGRAEWISPPRHTRSLLPALAQNGVIHPRYHRSIFALLVHGFPKNDVGYPVSVIAGLGELPVVRIPVLELPSGGADIAGHRMSPQPHQLAQELDSSLLRGPRLFKGSPDGLEDSVELGEDARCFFLRALGGVCFLISAKRPRPSICHSITSPWRKSMAWATWAGKLTYHCWLCLRRMSCSLVGYPMSGSPFYLVI